MTDSAQFIDRLRDEAGHLDREAIRSILPYGEAFLFLDAVSRLTATEIEATYRVPHDEPFIRAHFEGLSVMPGALIGEGLAQAGTLLIRYNLENHATRDILAYQVDHALFSAPAAPGDELRFIVRLQNLRPRAARLEGEVFVGEHRTGKVKMVLAIVPREQLRARLIASNSQ